MTKSKTPRSYKDVIKHFNESSEDVQWYFQDLENLVAEYAWQVSIGYVFSQIERAKRMTLYCGIVKLHRCDASLTQTLIDREHLSRTRFIDLFGTVFGEPIPMDLIGRLKEAETIRDRAAHGSKDWREADARQCLVDAIGFAEGFNKFVYEQAGFRPFGKLQGFKGRRVALPKATTNWILKGMGIGSKTNR